MKLIKAMFSVNFLRFLMVAIIPILFMFSCDSGNHTEQDHEMESATYTCPMHPQVVQKTPGTCPICHMDLVKVVAGETAENEITLSESQIKLGNIQTRKVSESELANKVALTGKVVENSELTNLISSRITGRIERLHIKETGLSIRKGQPLYEIYSEELLTYQKEFLMALEQYREVDSTSARYASLLAAARKKLVLFGLSPAQVNQLEKSKQTMQNITFLAPASGLVSEIMVKEGSYVDEGTALYRVVQLDPIWVEAELYQGETEQVQVGNEVQAIINGYEHEPIMGKVTFLSPEYRAGSQIITLRVEIPNPDQKFLPGMQANVLLKQQNQNNITVPVEAVIRDEIGSHVWVTKGEGNYTSKMVETGMETADQIEIIAGLASTDTVVISGGYLLYSEYVLKKGGDPMAGHQHE